MIPMLKDWDAKWATAEELKVIAEHNRESGIAELNISGSGAPTLA